MEEKRKVRRERDKIEKNEWRKRDKMEVTDEKEVGKRQKMRE